MNKQQYLLECLIKEIVLIISEKDYCNIDEAMNKFYNSVTFDKLTNLKTGLYRESTGYVYDIYKLEQENKGFVQMEI